ncbi:MAG: hypothetical protein H7338_00795 [Candidatus Sericytochromatia bacterium]|nr:hypothetical protein [Candidatus Sericytochromatia bacterium]
MSKNDLPGKPKKQVYSRRGTSFLTLSSSYESEQQARHTGESSDESFVTSGPAHDAGPQAKASLRDRMMGRKGPLREVLNEQVTSVRDARGQVHERLMEVSDVFGLQFLAIVELLGNYVLRGIEYVKYPFRPIYRRWMILWAGEDYFNVPLDDINEKAPPPIDFVLLAEKNIVFTDNHKNPLYTMDQLRTAKGYTASSEVVKPLIMEKVYVAFQEVAPKARGLPVPDKGRYAGRAMDDVLFNINEIDVALFFDYVLRFPVGYVGKNYRLTESFAGWAVSGTPDD